MSISPIPFTGSGTETDPYLIENLGNLVYLSEVYAPMSVGFEFFKQTANIDASETLTHDSGQGFLPIGLRYSGYSYDGDGHTIDKLYINRSVGYAGLFSSVQQANLKNIILNDVDITNTSTFSGGTGGLCGVLSTYLPSNVSRCYVSGKVNATKGHVGGLLGLSNYAVGEITECGTSGEVSIIDGGAGGLVGYVPGRAQYNNCYSTASVSGSLAAGGLFGQIADTYLTTNCYAAGPVVGGTYSGGICGYAFGFTFVDVFYDTEVTGQTGSERGYVAKTTAEMQDQSTFTNWDFETIWYMGQSGYPELFVFKPDDPDPGPDYYKNTVAERLLEQYSKPLYNIEGNIAFPVYEKKQKPYEVLLESNGKVAVNPDDYFYGELPYKNESDELIQTKLDNDIAGKLLQQYSKSLIN